MSSNIPENHSLNSLTGKVGIPKKILNKPNNNIVNEQIKEYFKKNEAKEIYKENDMFPDKYKNQKYEGSVIKQQGEQLDILNCQLELENLNADSKFNEKEGVVFKSERIDELVKNIAKQKAEIHEDIKNKNWESVKDKQDALEKNILELNSIKQIMTETYETLKKQIEEQDKKDNVKFGLDE